MKNRKKVILHRRDGWGDDRKLALTDEQISLLNWLADRDLIDNEIWDIQVLEEAENWEEV
jgi:hypothetical protein